MSRSITEDEFVRRPADVLREVGDHTTFIEKDGKPVAAVVSMQEYDTTHEARARRAIDALNAVGKYMQENYSTEELAALEKALDRKAV